MRAPRANLPQWKIHLVRGAMEFLEDDMGGLVTPTMIARRIPSFSLSDIEYAIKFLTERHSTER